MTFSAKMDSAYKKTLAAVVFIVAASCFIPLFFTPYDFTGFLILGGTFLVTIGFLVWSHANITYTFYEEYLVAKGGPLRFKIPYKSITRVARTTDFLTGMRLSTAKDGLAIYYSASWMGELKISPAEQEAFLKELFKRAPQAKWDV